MKWPLLINPDVVWGKVIYGALTLIRNSDKDLPIDLTNAVFMMQPSKSKNMQINVSQEIIFNKERPLLIHYI